MRPVSEKEVVSEWLSLENQKGNSPDVSIEADKKHNENFARLLLHKPDSASLFRKFDLRWYRHELSEDEFQELQTIWEENRLIFDIARDIYNGESDLSTERIERIKRFAERLPQNTHGPLILNRRRWFGKGPYVTDGNHRAISLALHMFRGGDYIPQNAYVGYPTPIIGFSRIIRGRFHRIIDRA